MIDDAFAVIQRLVREDDESIEAWYLGGWSRLLQAEAIETKRQSGGFSDEQTRALDHALRQSRRWLGHAVKLYDQLDYEDVRLQAHAVELLAEINKKLGRKPEDEDESSESEAEWQGIDDTNGDIDHEMEDV